MDVVLAEMVVPAEEQGTELQLDLLAGHDTSGETVSSSEDTKPTRNQAVGPSHRTCFFGGYDSLNGSPQALFDIAGVSEHVFALLLSLFPAVRDRGSDVTIENKLLLFLVKLKLAISFSSLGALFRVYERTASRIFHSILGTLATATENWVFKPPSTDIELELPPCFRVNYPDCRLIVDCTEVRTEIPSEVRQRHNLYSQYKGGYTLKFLVAIAPNGMVVFRSKQFGGRFSDTDITLKSGFLDLVEPGDVVLADKGFPGIKAGLAEKDAVLVMPPFSCGNVPFTKDEIDTTYNIASVRIHVERAIQRIKKYNILNNRIPVSLIPAMSDVFHMCCVLANLQKRLIKKTCTESL